MVTQPVNFTQNSTQLAVFAKNRVSFSYNQTHLPREPTCQGNDADDTTFLRFKGWLSDNEGFPFDRFYFHNM